MTHLDQGPWESISWNVLNGDSLLLSSPEVGGTKQVAGVSCSAI